MLVLLFNRIDAIKNNMHCRKQFVLVLFFHRICFCISSFGGVVLQKKNNATPNSYLLIRIEQTNPISLLHFSREYLFKKIRF